MLAGLAYYQDGVNVQPQKTRFRGYARLMGGRLGKKNGFAADQIINIFLSLGEFGGNLHCYIVPKKGKKARRQV